MPIFTNPRRDFSIGMNGCWQKHIPIAVHTYGKTACFTDFCRSKYLKFGVINTWTIGIAQKDFFCFDGFSNLEPYLPEGLLYIFFPLSSPAIIGKKKIIHDFSPALKITQCMWIWSLYSGLGKTFLPCSISTVYAVAISHGILDTTNLKINQTTPLIMCS